MEALATMDTRRGNNRSTDASLSTTTVTRATTTASECRSWMNRTDRCQRDQGYNRFLHHAFPALFGTMSLSSIQHFRGGITRRTDSVPSKVTTDGVAVSRVGVFQRCQTGNLACIAKTKSRPKAAFQSTVIDRWFRPHLMLASTFDDVP
jgi:hypothetical protein